MATQLKFNAISVLRPTVQGLLKNCPINVCLAVVREAFILAHGYTLEAISYVNYDECNSLIFYQFNNVLEPE